MHVLVVRSRLSGLASPVPIIFLVLRFFLDLAVSTPSYVLPLRCPGGGSGLWLPLDFDLEFTLTFSFFFFSVRLVLFVFVRRARFVIVLVFLRMNADLNHGLDDCDPIIFPPVLFGSSATYIPPVPSVSELFALVLRRACIFFCAE